MSHWQFLLDENIDPDLRVALQRDQSAITVWIVGDPGAPARGTDDPSILKWCEDHGFALVTRNRASMPVHLAEHCNQGHTMLGIFVPAVDMSFGEIADAILLIWEAAQLTEFENQIVYLPL